MIEAAFDFLRVAQAFNHEAVCNAIMALEYEELSVSLSAGCFLACACLLARNNDRRPAMTAMLGTSAELRLLQLQSK